MGGSRKLPTVDDGHGSPGGGRDKVWVDLEYGPLTEQSLRQILTRQLPRSLQLLVPVPVEEKLNI